ncbi:MAG: Hpt domain-containing protein [Treponema sp.]|jgi:HPt (histidine-containing phosphotransfer) domain-containing protein|nr:Hpt domain-containing protein [Treponema sp.]
MSSIAYIDEEDGKKRLMNNSKLYAKILAKFKSDTNLDNLLSSIADQDWEQAQAAIHAIKGVAANLSLPELFRQSLDVETQLKSKALKNESLENFKLCFSQTLVQVEEVIAANA